MRKKQQQQQQYQWMKYTLWILYILFRDQLEIKLLWCACQYLCKTEDDWIRARYDDDDIGWCEILFNSSIQRSSISMHGWHSIKWKQYNRIKKNRIWKWDRNVKNFVGSTHSKFRVSLQNTLLYRFESLTWIEYGTPSAACDCVHTLFPANNSVLEIFLFLHNTKWSVQKYDWLSNSISFELFIFSFSFRISLMFFTEMKWHSTLLLSPHPL